MENPLPLEFEGDMEHFKSHPNITSEKDELSSVLVRDYYGLEFTVPESLRRTRNFLKQMVEALIFIHKHGCYHVKLRECKSFVFAGDFLQIDLGGIRTSIDLPEREQKSDISDLSCAISKYFGGQQAVANRLLLDVDVSIRQPIIRGLPTFESYMFLGKSASKNIFEAEVKHLISLLIMTNPPNAKEILNHPFFWTSDKRLQFLVDTQEYVSSLDGNVKLVVEKEINKAASSSFQKKVTIFPELERDLCHNPDGNTLLRRSILSHPSVLLRAIRNCRVHSFRHIRGFYSHAKLSLLDNDPIRAFDLVLSALWPNFFIEIYDFMSRKPLPPSFVKYVDKEYMMD